MSTTETKEKRLKSYWIRKDLLARLLLVMKREGCSEAGLVNRALEYALDALLGVEDKP